MQRVFNIFALFTDCTNRTVQRQTGTPARLPHFSHPHAPLCTSLCLLPSAEVVPILMHILSFQNILTFNHFFSIYGNTNSPSWIGGVIALCCGVFGPLPAHKIPNTPSHVAQGEQASGHDRAGTSHLFRLTRTGCKELRDHGGLLIWQNPQLLPQSGKSSMAHGILLLD